MSKEIKYHDEARKSIKNGSDIIGNAVKTTLGAKGKYVMLEKKDSAPLITNDGITIAKDIELPDKFENLAAQLIKEVSVKTNDLAGDGTTTAIILAQALIRESIKNIIAGTNAIHIKNGMDKALKVVIDYIRQTSKRLNSKEEIAQLATISSNDKEIGNLIADTLDKVGENGIVVIEDGKTLETKTKIVKGMQFDNGYLSPYFVTNSERMIAIYENPYIVITDKKILSIQEILPLLEKLAKTKKPFLLIAEDISGDVLATLIRNKLKNSLKVIAIKAPAFGNLRKEILEDLAILTNGIVISTDLGLTFENVTLEMLGKSETLKVTKNETTILNSAANKEKIDNRIIQLKMQLENPKSEYDKERLQERIAKLSKGSAIIQVGASTETELKTKKFKIEDALHTARSGIEEGIIAGGGITFLKASFKLEYIECLNRDEELGIQIVKKALEEPITQLLINAGFEPAPVINNILSSRNENAGFDVENGEYKDMVQAGIIDTAKVARCALQNAISIANLLITTDCMIVDNRFTEIKKSK